MDRASVGIRWLRGCCTDYLERVSRPSHSRQTPPAYKTSLLENRSRSGTDPSPNQAEGSFPTTAAGLFSSSEQRTLGKPHFSSSTTPSAVEHEGFSDVRDSSVYGSQRRRKRFLQTFKTHATMVDVQLVSSEALNHLSPILHPKPGFGTYDDRYIKVYRFFGYFVL